MFDLDAKLSAMFWHQKMKGGISVTLLFLFFALV